MQFAIRLLMTDVRSLVNEGGRGGSAGPWRQRMLGGMVVAEIALAVVVVIGAGLLVRSFDKLRSIDPGFRPEGVVTVWDMVVSFTIKMIALCAEYIWAKALKWHEF